MSPRKSAALTRVLDRLEVSYGVLVPSDDAVEAGILALLAHHAPHLSSVKTRQALREWFVNWNELRVADPWDIAHAIGAKSDPQAAAFARATLKFMKSLHHRLNRTSFDLVQADPDADVAAIVGAMRGVPAPSKCVMLAVLAGEGEWRIDKETSKLVQGMSLAPKSTSTAKTGRALAEQAKDDDRLRAHYLLARYAHRPGDDEDPLATTSRRTPKKAGAKKTSSRKTAKSTGKKAAAKKATKKTAAKKTAKRAAKKTASKKTASKKAVSKKAVSKRTASKKTARKSAKKATKKASSRKRAKSTRKSSRSK